MPTFASLCYSDSIYSRIVPSIIERKDANKTFYSKEISAEEILTGKTDKPQSSISGLYETIKKAEERESH